MTKTFSAAVVHADVDRQADRLLAEAKKIIAGANAPANTTYLAKLAALGFGGSKEARAEQNKKADQERAERIVYYEQTYPMAKFIDKDTLERLCSHYKLTYSEPHRYVGSIPEKNQKEIVEFMVYKADMESSYTQAVWGVSGVDPRWNVGVDPYRSPQNYSYAENYFRQVMRFNSQSGQVEQFQLPAQREVRKELPAPVLPERVAPTFLMVAPPEMYELGKYEKFIGNTVDPDPIVLATVKLGYLVVSKWGAESSLPALINPKEN